MSGKIAASDTTLSNSQPWPYELRELIIITHNTMVFLIKGLTCYKNLNKNQYEWLLTLKTDLYGYQKVKMNTTNTDIAFEGFKCLLLEMHSYIINLRDQKVFDTF